MDQKCLHKKNKCPSIDEDIQNTYQEKRYKL
jgi:hypothetical protein